MPLDALILLIKFDIDKSRIFLPAAKQFFIAFGTLSLKSLMILCIQSNSERIYCDDDFKEIFLNSDGYKYLKEKNNSVDIPYILWDNFQSYAEQKEHFNRAVNILQQFEMQNLQNVLDKIESELEIEQERKQERNTEEPKKNDWCDIL